MKRKNKIEQNLKKCEIKKIKIQNKRNENREGN